MDLPVRAARRGEVAPTVAVAPEAAAPVAAHHPPSPGFNRRELTRDQGRRRNASVHRGRLRSGSDELADLDLTDLGLRTREPTASSPKTPRFRPRRSCHWTEERSRGDWKVRAETTSAMAATATHWHITGRL